MNEMLNCKHEPSVGEITVMFAATLASLQGNARRR
jgi:hypothetical protein